MFKRNLIFGLAVATAILVVAAPAEAQREFEPLFDKFNFKLEGSWVGFKTQFRLDSDLTPGEGTTVSFEDDLNLAKNETVPSLSFEWQIARKHRLGFRWQDINRASSAQALTEIEWGDEVIPVNADITLGFDITQYFIDYTYYPWVKEKWAAGFGFGIRAMDLLATLQWEEETIGEGGNDVDGLAPLPYLYFEYRRLFSERWRFITGLGWLYVKVGDVKGGQWIGRASIEYLLGKRWSFGGGFNLSNVDVDWEGLKDEEGDTHLTGHFDLDINDISVFARVRF